MFFSEKCKSSQSYPTAAQQSDICPFQHILYGLTDTLNWLSEIMTLFQFICFGKAIIPYFKIKRHALFQDCHSLSLNIYETLTHLCCALLGNKTSYVTCFVISSHHALLYRMVCWSVGFDCFPTTSASKIICSLNKVVSKTRQTSTV